MNNYKDNAIFPSIQDFVDKMRDTWDSEIKEKNYLSTRIYQVLFSESINNYDPTNKKILETLLLSKDPGDSLEVFKAIAQQFPKSRPYMLSLWWYGNFLQRNSKENTLFAKGFDVKKMLPSFKEEAVLKEVLEKDIENLMTEYFKEYLKNHNITSPELQNLEFSYSILDEPIEKKGIKISAKIANEKQYKAIENGDGVNHLSDFLKKTLKLPNFYFNYDIPNPNTSKTDGNKKKEKIIIPQSLKQKNILKELSLAENPNFSKENYIGNAYTSVENQLAERKKIYLYGDTGTGKSHLIQAYLKEIRAQGQDMSKVLYVSAHTLSRLYMSYAREDLSLYKQNQKYGNNVNELKESLGGLATIIVDDADVLTEGKKVSTQDMIYSLAQTVQLVLIGKKAPNEAKGYKKIYLAEKGTDFIPVDQWIGHLKLVPIKIQAIKDNSLLLDNLFSRFDFINLFLNAEMVEKVKKFILDADIKQENYEQLIRTLHQNKHLFENEEKEEEIVTTIYNIIGDNTGKTIRPKIETIWSIIKKTFKDQSNPMFDTLFTTFGAFPETLNLEKSRYPIDSWGGIALRIYVFFIKKYYPEKTNKDIEVIINRTNISVLYREAEEWFTAHGKEIEKYISDAINQELYELYGIQSKIDS